jgi:hypothetical protein
MPPLECAAGGLKLQGLTGGPASRFRNCYPDPARLFPELVARRVPAISIDEPDRRRRDGVFEIQEMPEPALRTLVAPMCLVQALAIGLDLAAD